ncbi:MAG: hypothetical protein H7338_17470 [Candidatus Sericytochromatia bacterium]|nr:hypothetical protein [Candidatus Sericytochromatia bacterium]
MTNPITNRVPNVAISAEALRVLDTNRDAEVTVEELNIGLAASTVAFSAQGKVVPKPVSLIDAPVSGPNTGDAALPKPLAATGPKPSDVSTPPIQDATVPKAVDTATPQTVEVTPVKPVVTNKPHPATKAVLTSVDAASKGVASKGTDPRKFAALDVSLVAINRQIQDTKPLFPPQIRETAAMAVMHLLQAKSSPAATAAAVAVGVQALTDLKTQLENQ